MKRILICEDESSIRAFIVVNMRRAGYDVVEAGTGEDAVQLYEEALESKEGKIDIALLDVMLPGINGFEVCKTLRQKDETMGIIMLTARSQDAEKVQGLKTGADDYVTKPFSPTELVARVNALYRRIDAVQTKESIQYVEDLISGVFTLNIRSRTLKKNGELIDLTQLEFQILEYFFTNPNKIFTRIDILKRVWGNDFYGDDKIVDVNIRRLRMKLEDDPSNPKHICTVWGKGYKWEQ